MSTLSKSRKSSWNIAEREREGVNTKPGKLIQCWKRVFLYPSFSFALPWLAWNPHWAWLFAYFRPLGFKFMQWKVRMALWSCDSFQSTEESNTLPAHSKSISWGWSCNQRLGGKNWIPPARPRQVDIDPTKASSGKKLHPARPLGHQALMK